MFAWQSNTRDPRSGRADGRDAHGRLRAERHRRLRLEHAGSLPSPRPRRRRRSPPAGAKTAYKRAPYTKPALKYLYALGWIGGTKNPGQCGLTLLGQDAAKEQAAREMRSNTKLMAQLQEACDQRLGGRECGHQGRRLSVRVDAGLSAPRSALQGLAGGGGVLPPMHAAQADDAHHRVAVDHGQVAEAVVEHDLLRLLERLSGVAVIGSSVIHWRTRASLVCTRAAIAFSMSRSVRMPISRPKSLTTTAPTFLRRHPLRDLAQRVLGGDLMKFGLTISARAFP